MDCGKSIEQLSDFHDGEIDEANRTQVSAHLAGCPPCTGLYTDLDRIIVAASALRDGQGISYPNEEAMWQRLRLDGTKIH